MPTSHLFKFSDLEALENKLLAGNYKILVVGTFNGEIEGNKATWFYGRPENEFWCLFPRMLGYNTLHPVDRDEHIDELTKLWKGFCRDQQVIIVDIFKEVLIDISNHSDANLQKLSPNQYHLFDYKKAFSHCYFEHVIFTWKGTGNNTLTAIKDEYIKFFTARGSRILQLVTPSNAYSKPRVFKLEKWKEAYRQ
jgi:G:T/U-mismatch repair DNA glycosylase